MTINKRKKNTRQRGTHTHGWGAKKKHRGAGNRGGRGMAGTGKRGDATKPRIWGRKYFGKFGFKKKNVVKIKAVNISYLEDNLKSFLNDKLVLKENELYVVDMKKLGFNKLLSQGNVLNKFKIKVSYASKKAVEKIKNKGGDVDLLKKEKISTEKKQLDKSKNKNKKIGKKTKT
ncbi:uL15 family ribosomal protein [Candidatus Woesearchaeota archaeon]|nr:uL15 family ribosomal protein [Candidatus Woesearchaeota archaeon]